MDADLSSIEPTATAAVSSDARFYNPYKDLDRPAAKLYNLPTSLEYLNLEDTNIPFRDWSKNLLCSTGICYLSGGAVGGVLGVARGIKAAEAGESGKLRLSRVLSSGGDVSRRFSNNMGIVGLYFSVFESGIDSYRGKEGVLNSCLAGFGTGVVYRAARGVRAMAVAGVIGGAGALAAVGGEKDGEEVCWRSHWAFGGLKVNNC